MNIIGQGFLSYSRSRLLILFSDPICDDRARNYTKRVQTYNTALLYVIGRANVPAPAHVLYSWRNGNKNGGVTALMSHFDRVDIE